MADVPKQPPTSHELARRLLALPDLPLISRNDAVEFRLVDVWEDQSASWSEEGLWVDDQPAVVIVDHTEAPIWSYRAPGSGDEL